MGTPTHGDALGQRLQGVLDLCDFAAHDARDGHQRVAHGVFRTLAHALARKVMLLGGPQKGAHVAIAKVVAGH